MRYERGRTLSVIERISVGESFGRMDGIVYPVI